MPIIKSDGPSGTQRNYLYLKIVKTIHGRQLADLQKFPFQVNQWTAGTQSSSLVTCYRCARGYKWNDVLHCRRLRDCDRHDHTKLCLRCHRQSRRLGVARHNQWRLSFSWQLATSIQRLKKPQLFISLRDADALPATKLTCLFMLSEEIMTCFFMDGRAQAEHGAKPVAAADFLLREVHPCWR